MERFKRPSRPAPKFPMIQGKRVKKKDDITDGGPNWKWNCPYYDGCCLCLGCKRLASYSSIICDGHKKVAWVNNGPANK